MATKTPVRPTSLKVGYITFSVEYVPDEEWLKRGLPEGDGGQTHGAKATIIVRDVEEQDEIHVREILLHEVLHACFYACGMTIEGGFHSHDDIEEHVIGRMSPTLLDVLRTNPELSKYLEG